MNVGTELEASCENCASTTQTVTSVSHGATATVMCNGCGATRRYVASVDSIVPEKTETVVAAVSKPCLLYTSPSPRDRTRSRMPSSA